MMARKTDARLAFLARLVVIPLAGVATLIGGGASGSMRPPQPHRYYLSSSSGNDAWSGTSSDRPWRTLNAVRANQFRPGDQILLKAGERFAGQLDLRSSGAPGNPIVVTRYGQGARPLIDGAASPAGAYSSAMLVRNQHDIEIRSLEIVNSVDKPMPGQSDDTAEGILIVNDGAGPLGNYVLTDLYIHDVFAKAIAAGSEDEFNRVSVSGIRFQVTARQTAAKPSFFRNVQITRNRISRTGRFGLQMDDPGPRLAGNADAHHRNPETGFNREILIADNHFVETGGSGVQLAGARIALIDNNEFDRCGSKVVPDRMVGRGSGAWVINSRDIVAQHNRSLHIRGYKDSYGMHVDFGNLNVIYQYNWSQDSEGGFIEILGDNRNITWRYNISVNDGLREKEGNTLWFSTWSPRRIRSDGIYINNNTVYIRSGLSPDLSFTALGASIWNNIFSIATGAEMGRELTVDMRGKGLTLGNNLFFGTVNPRVLAMGSGNVVADPRLASPGSFDPSGYRLLPGSPALGGGKPVDIPDFPEAGKGIFARISAVAKVDFFNNPIAHNQRPNIGADAANPGPP